MTTMTDLEAVFFLAGLVASSGDCGVGCSVAWLEGWLVLGWPVLH